MKPQCSVAFFGRSHFIATNFQTPAKLATEQKTYASEEYTLRARAVSRAYAAMTKTDKHGSQEHCECRAWLQKDLERDFSDRPFPAGMATEILAELQAKDVEEKKQFEASQQARRERDLEKDRIHTMKVRMHQMWTRAQQRKFGGQPAPADESHPNLLPTYNEMKVVRSGVRLRIQLPSAPTPPLPSATNSAIDTDKKGLCVKCGRRSICLSLLTALWLAACLIYWLMAPWRSRRV